MKKCQVSSGSIVLSRERTLLVLRESEGSLVVCPLVTSSEPMHRADLTLEWHELVDAGLARLDVRCRAVVGRRTAGAVRWIGCVGPETVARVEAAALREERARQQEIGVRDGEGAGRGARRIGRPRREPVRAIWLDQGLMSCREAAHRVV